MPIPTFPLPDTTKCVPVDEPITNSGTPVPSAFGFTESCAHGVEVPRPSKPAPVVLLAVILSVVVPFSW